MLGFNHTLAGCIAAVIIPAPAAPLVALISHYVFDTTPHFGRHPGIYPGSRGFRRLLIADGILCLLSLTLGIVLFPHLWWLLVICSAASVAPDFMWLFFGKVSWLKRYHRFAAAIQWGERPYGWTFDLIYGAIFVSILVYLS